MSTSTRNPLFEIEPSPPLLDKMGTGNPTEGNATNLWGFHHPSSTHFSAAARTPPLLTFQFFMPFRPSSTLSHFIALSSNIDDSQHIDTASCQGYKCVDALLSTIKLLN